MFCSCGLYVILDSLWLSALHAGKEDSGEVDSSHKDSSHKLSKAENYQEAVSLRSVIIPNYMTLFVVPWEVHVFVR